MAFTVSDDGIGIGLGTSIVEALIRQAVASRHPKHRPERTFQ
jgi:hypothetical protein